MDLNNSTESENRKRVCSPAEQREFARLGRLLLANDVSLEEIRLALGYDGLEGVRRALDVARVTTDRLEQLRALVQAKLGEEALTPPAAPAPPSPRFTLPSERSTALPVRAATPAPPASELPAPPRVRVELDPAGLTRAQQRRLRDTIENLCAADSRLRDPALLARAVGLGSAYELEEALESGGTPAILRALDEFARLHAAFSSRATLALMEGVPTGELQQYLVNERQPAAGRTRPAPSGAGSTIDARGEDEGMIDARVGVGTEPAEVSGEAHEGGEGAVRGDQAVEGSANGAGPGGAPAAKPRKPYRSRGRSKVHLTKAQHEQLREVVQGLWARDDRLKNWSLLARAAGLSNGPAVKRAYEVNSSVTTLNNLSTFASLHERFGRAATSALRNGVAIEELEAHLERLATGAQARTTREEPAGAAAAASEAPVSGAARALAGSEVPGAEPRGDFARILELGRRIDAELVHLHRAAALFDEVSRQGGVPPFLRVNAGAARDHLKSVLRMFAADAEERG